MRGGGWRMYGGAVEDGALGESLAAGARWRISGREMIG